MFVKDFFFTDPVVRLHATRWTLRVVTCAGCMLILPAFPSHALAAKISAVYTPGAMIIGYDATCTGNAGALRYNSSNTSFEFCNGTSWATYTVTTPASGTIGAAGGLYVNLVDSVVSSPGLQFKNQAGTGIYRPGSPWFMQFARNGSQSAYFDGNGNYNQNNDYLIGGVQVMYYPAASNSMGLGQNALGGGSLSGDANVALGANALLNDTSGRANIAIGTSAAAQLTTGSGNIAIGRAALNGGAVGGDNNIAVGDHALLAATTTADSNVAFGANALSSMATDVSIVAFGYNALAATTIGPNTAFGYQAGQYNDTANWDVFVGANAGRGSAVTPTTNGGLTSVGANANMSAQGLAQDNIAIGGQALKNNTDDNQTVAIGSNVLTTGTNSNSQSTVVGAFAGANVATGSGTVTAIGQGAYRYVSGGAAQGNTAIGVAAMAGTSGSNMTGNSNTAIGYNSMLVTTAATGVLGAGYQSLAGLTSGFNNTGAGYQAGYAGTPITTEDSDTFIGNQTGASSAGLVNVTAIGNGARATVSNSVVLGNGSISTLYAKVGLTSLSDRRHKRDITALTPDLGLAFINKLKPVAYRYNNGDESLRYGFIAQDLEQALPPALQAKIENAKDATTGVALVERGNDKDHTYRAGYAELISPIVKAIKEQQDQIDALRKKIAAAKAHQIELRQMITARAAAIRTLQNDNAEMRRSLTALAARGKSEEYHHD